MRSCTGLAVALALATGAGYCWLNSWRWGSAPELHASFTAEEAAMLQSCDSLIAENGAGQFLDIGELDIEPSLYARSMLFWNPGHGIPVSEEASIL